MSDYKWAFMNKGESLHALVEVPDNPGWFSSLCGPAAYGTSRVRIIDDLTPTQLLCKSCKSVIRMREAKEARSHD